MKTPHIVIITRQGSIKNWLEIHVVPLDPALELEEQVDQLYKIGNSDDFQAREASLENLRVFTERLVSAGTDVREKYHRQVRIENEKKHNLRHSK